MKLCYSARVLAGAILFWICAVAAPSQGIAPKTGDAPAISPQAKAVAQGINALTCEIYEKLKTQDANNQALSAFSIETAMGMAYAGAQGNTAAEMGKVLHLEQGQQVHAAIGELLKATGGQLKGGNELNIANALWVVNRMKLLEPFTQNMKANYEGGFHGVPVFNEAVRGEINGWVSDKTKEKIKDLIPKGVLDAMTRMVLVNAIYFKGSWLAPFKEESTKPMDFNRADGQKVSVPGMHDTGKYQETTMVRGKERSRSRQAFRYAEDAESGVKLLEMPYAGEELAMDIVLPNATDGLGKLQLTAQAWERWVASLDKKTAAPVIVTLPKFKLKSKFELSKCFMDLGIKDAFGPKADFWGMTAPNPEGFFISQIIHQAVVEVDEKGTVAAAATALVMVGGAAPKKVEIPVFNADHPFLFAIRDRRSGAILFLGRVSDPSQ